MKQIIIIVRGKTFNLDWQSHSKYRKKASTLWSRTHSPKPYVFEINKCCYFACTSCLWLSGRLLLSPVMKLWMCTVHSNTHTHKQCLMSQSRVHVSLLIFSIIFDSSRLQMFVVETASRYKTTSEFCVIKAGRPRQSRMYNSVFVTRKHCQQLLHKSIHLERRDYEKCPNDFWVIESLCTPPNLIWFLHDSD